MLGYIMIDSYITTPCMKKSLQKKSTDGIMTYSTTEKTRKFKAINVNVSSLSDDDESLCCTLT